MPPKLTAIIAIALVITIESAIAIWRAIPPAPQTAATFHWPWTDEPSPDPVSMARAIEVYDANRGWERQFNDGEGLTMIAHFFEWSEVKTAPMMIISGHTPKECNAAAGFALISEDAPREWRSATGNTLKFHSSRFRTTDGGNLFVFKTAWLQGLGSITLNPGSNRFERIRGSLAPITGEGRVLQAGIFGAPDPQTAWNYFESDVLKKLAWSH